MAATTIYVRLAASATGGAVSGNVTVASTGASSVNVAVSGRVNSAVALTFGPQDFEANNVPFVTYSVAGNKDWSYVINSTLGGGVTTAPLNKAMEVNGFGGDVASNDWLILGPIDASAANNPVVTFNTLTRFANNAVNELTLKVSTDYTGTGSPAGATWTTLTYNVPAANTITKTASGQVALTGAANQNNVYVAWNYQAGGTTSGASGLWQVDDVTVQNALKPALLISAPGVLNEGVTSDGTGTVSIPLALASDLEITVTSSDATELLVYTGANSGATSTVVTIPAGQTSATFSLETLADDLIDADQSVTLTASVGDNSYDSATATVSVKNLDVPSASLGSSGYTQDFSGFAQATPTLPTGWSVSGPVTTFNTSTNSSGVLTDVDWGSGTGAGLRGNGSVLGYQHTGSTEILQKILTLKNETGAVITEITVSYKGRVARPSEGRSPAYVVAVNGVAVPALAYSTADGDNTARTASLTGLSIANGTSFQITWSSDGSTTGSPGSGSRRQIGISEVSVTLEAATTAPAIGSLSIPAVNISRTGAQASANVTADGGAAISKRGFVIAATSVNPDPILGGAGVTDVEDFNEEKVGLMTQSFTSLTAGTSYTVKAYAVNSVGTTYTSGQSFTTVGPALSFTGTYSQPFDDYTGTTPAGWNAVSSTGSMSYGGVWGSGSSAGFRGTDANSGGVLGYQPTTTSGDLTVTLSLINNTGATIESLNIGYLGRVARADQGRTPTWAVTLNGQSVPELAYSTGNTSGEAGAPGDETKSFGLTGLSISNGAEFTITWTSTNPTGSGSSRQIGIADVVVSTSTPGPTAPSNLSYTPSTISGTVGTAISSLTPTVTGTVDTYSVDPALPDGLSIDAGSGVISGTPTAVAASDTYTITAANEGGSTTATVTVTVNSADTPQEQYLASYGLVKGTPEAAGTADPDGDGLNNAGEFAFGTNPASGASRAVTQESVVGGIKIKWLQRSGISYTVKSTVNLGSAFSGPVSSTPVSPQPSGLGDYQQYEATLTGGDRGFIKVEAIVP